MLNPSEIQSSGQDAKLFVGGELRASGLDEAFYERLGRVLSSFLQVKHLNILLGAGASFHVGSPSIRKMSSEGIKEMMSRANLFSGMSVSAAELLEALVEEGGGTVDLEDMLTMLSAAMTVLRATRSTRMTVGGFEAEIAAIEELRRLLNRSLANECDLPNEEQTDALERENPFRLHQDFFGKVLRARRSDLPRISVFTTNYDLMIERALDRSGVNYFDGFVGSIDRMFRPESFKQDLYRPPEPEERRVLRVKEVVYLYKLHGSINWRGRGSLLAPGGQEVYQVGAPGEYVGDELVLIFPTPQKDMDALGYPYSDLFRAFSMCLNRADSALLVIGYGFGDEHINRLIHEGLSGHSFQVFVVAPSGVSEGSEGSGSALDGLARVADPRVNVLTGSVAGTFRDLATRGLPSVGEVVEEGGTTERMEAVSEALLGGEGGSNEEG